MCSSIPYSVIYKNCNLQASVLKNVKDFNPKTFPVKIHIRKHKKMYSFQPCLSDLIWSLTFRRPWLRSWTLWSVCGLTGCCDVKDVPESFISHVGSEERASGPPRYASVWLGSKWQRGGNLSCGCEPEAAHCAEVMATCETPELCKTRDWFLYVWPFFDALKWNVRLFVRYFPCPRGLRRLKSDRGENKCHSTLRHSLGNNSCFKVHNRVTLSSSSSSSPKIRADMWL